MSKRELPEKQNLQFNELDGVEVSDNSNHDEEATNLKRRRALIAGLAAMPVLLTLRSRSVFAHEGPDCSIVLSIGLDAISSQHPGVQLTQQDYDRCERDEE